MANIPSSRIPELKEQHVTNFDQNFAVVVSSELNRHGRLKFSGLFDLAVQEIVRKIRANPSLFSNIATPTAIVYPLIEDLGNMVKGYASQQVTINTRQAKAVQDRQLTFREARVIFLGAAGGIGASSVVDDYIILDRVPSDTVLEGWTYGGSSQFGTRSAKYYFFRQTMLGEIGESLEGIITTLGIQVGVRVPASMPDCPEVPVQPPAPVSGFTLAQFSRFLKIDGVPLTFNNEPLELA